MRFDSIARVESRESASSAADDTGPSRADDRLQSARKSSITKRSLMDPSEEMGATRLPVTEMPLADSGTGVRLNIRVLEANWRSAEGRRTVASGPTVGAVVRGANRCSVGRQIDRMWDYWYVDTLVSKRSFRCSFPQYDPVLGPNEQVGSEYVGSEHVGVVGG